MTGDVPRPVIALAWSATMALLGALLYLVAVTTETGQREDAATLGLAAQVPDAVVAVSRWARAAAPWVLGALSLGAAGVWLVRRRPVVAALCVLVPSSVWVANTVLRDAVLDRPYLGSFGYLENTFPSGHVAVTACVCAVLVATFPAPRGSWQRPTGIAAAVAATCVLALASVWTQAHRGSDVWGGLLLAGVVIPWFVLAAQPRRRGAHGRVAVTRRITGADRAADTERRS